MRFQIDQMISRINRIAEFVRGFFISLERDRINAAVLHGWQEDFENELSDVDFVIAQGHFGQIAELVHAHCKSTGWVICQVLRHETTAAYCVCSAPDDPSISVALDACSDYRRNESILLPVEDLLDGRVALTWGGYRVSDNIGLKYRFAKAAAKKKDAVKCVEEFEGYEIEARNHCAKWLERSWNIRLGSWNAADVGTALKALRSQSNSRPALTSVMSLIRMANRVYQPSGMVLITGEETFETSAKQLERVFGRIHFRHYQKSDHWQFPMLKSLVRSTLIVLPQISRTWERLLPADCVHRFRPGGAPDTLCIEFANQLSRRCKCRENLS